MIVTHAEAFNFQSYENISFTYYNQGLSLVSGPTGAGKSTLLDLTPWILYGITSKEGAADDVKSWDSDKPTTGYCQVDFPDHTCIGVHRVRGKGSQNDLYWLEGVDHNPVRGKDLTETQKLLEARLGVSADLFLLGSYLTQFSKADSFFISKAKDRRDVLEKIADQEFAINLGEKASSARKDTNKLLVTAQNELPGVSGKLEGLRSSLDGLHKASKDWERKRDDRLADIRVRFSSFDTDLYNTLDTLATKSDAWKQEKDDKFAALGQEYLALEEPEEDALYAESTAALEQELADLKPTRCDKCGLLAASDKKAELIKLISDITAARKQNQALDLEWMRRHAAVAAQAALINPYLMGIEQAKAQTNPYGTQITALSAEVNPFQVQITATRYNIELSQAKQDKLTQDKSALDLKVSRLTWLYDRSFEMRGILMEQAVNRVKTQTNSYLERFFDAALRINLTVEGSDKIEVEIYNDGHLAPFRSLSGGERCMLKLAFSLSLMEAAQDKAGVSFGALMLDEPMNGLDGDLKAKAFGLLQELSTKYGTVLVVEHSEELKSMFDTKFVVAKENGRSTID